MDPETIERARAGDARALAALLDAVAPRLLVLARRLAGASADADGLVVDALERGARRLGELRDPAAIVGWFRRILVHRWRDELRRARRRDLFLEDVAEPAAAPSDGPVARAELAELEERVRAAFERLPPAQRAVIALTVDEGLAVADIARLLETTADRVKANLWHARERLRRELGDVARR